MKPCPWRTGGCDRTLTRFYGYWGSRPSEPHTVYGWMTTAIFTGKYAGVRVLCWAEVRIVGGAFGDRCLVVKKFDRSHGLQQGALPP